jgi:hypothetical protein
MVTQLHPSNLIAIQFHLPNLIAIQFHLSNLEAILNKKFLRMANGKPSIVEMEMPIRERAIINFLKSPDSIFAQLKLDDIKSFFTIK